jgi:GDPmannose 4,6-dehydratase
MFGLTVENDGFQRETSIMNPVSPYGCSKVFGYNIVRHYRRAHKLHAVNGILFNHESPRRGKTFITRKITLAVARIKLGLDKCLYIGNLDAKRDWGYAKEYVEAMHLMLQQSKAEEFAIGTGRNFSVRYFIEKTFKISGINIVWKGKGINEVGVNKENNKTLVRVEKFFFRPSEVDTLLCDPRKAKKILNWKAKMHIDDLISKMYESDYNTLKNIYL